LSRDAQEVLDSLVAKEKPVRTKDGRWYLNRVIPCRTLDNLIDGVVVTFTDISEQKIAELVLAARNLAEGVVETVGDPLVALDGSLRVVAANTAFTGSSKRIRTRPLANTFTISETANGTSPRLRELWNKSCRRTARSIILSSSMIFRGSAEKDDD
jgi:two-component system CheB/CheR fusion protein